MAYPSTILSRVHATASEFLSNLFGGFGHIEQHNEMIDELTATQTKVGTGASSPTTTGHVLSVTGTGATAYQHAALTRVESDLGADVNLNNTSNFFDGPSVSLTAGTWLITGSVLVVDTAGSAGIIGKLWDGTTVESSSQVTTSGTSVALPIALSGVVSPVGTTTYKISCRDISSTNGKILAACSLGTQGNNASHIRATRIG